MTRNEIIAELKRKKEINPDEYDGSYELVRETVKSLHLVEFNNLDYKDLDMLYLMTIGTWKSNFKNKKSKIKDSNLPKEEKNRLINLLDELRNNNYLLHGEKDKIGMFGTGFYTFSRGGRETSSRDVKKIIQMCFKILKENKEEDCLKIAEEYLSENIYGLGAASLSQILHCIKPFYFPVINSVGVELYEFLGINISKKGDITTFVSNVRKIKKFRDHKFDFKNYRIIDDLAWGKLDKKDLFELAEPFKTIFKDSDEAYWFFNFLKDIANRLGVNNSDDERLVITLGENKLRLTYCRWAIFEINTTKNDRKINTALLASDSNLYEENATFNYSQNKNEADIKSYSLNIEDFKREERYRNILLRTLKQVKKRFSNYNSSPHQSSYHDDIAPAIFDKKILDKILRQGVNNENNNNDSELILNIPKVDFDQQLEIENLYFPQEQKEKIITQVITNLRQGKHIILTGPPGTGKSKLAEEICTNYTDDHNMVTATADWSTFDTIGGYKPDKNRQLSFNSGLFLDCFKKDKQLRNQWLVIDEINRADIDKAFGSLFSVLTGDSITLSFKAENGKNIVVKPEEKTDLDVVEPQEYIVPKDWRLIATMNTFDKTSLYEMSYAFMRRFAFVPVTIPKNINAELIAEYLKVWAIEDKSYIAEIAELWKEINKTQKIGPAIVKDIYQYVAASQGDFVSSLMMYVLPQFEGLREQKLNDFINSVSQFDFIAEVDKNELKNFVADYFRLGV